MNCMISIIFNGSVRIVPERYVYDVINTFNVKYEDYVILVTDHNGINFIEQHHIPGIISLTDRSDLLFKFMTVIKHGDANVATELHL